MTYISEIIKKINSGEMNLIFKAKILYFLDQHIDSNEVYSTIDHNAFLNEVVVYLKA